MSLDFLGRINPVLIVVVVVGATLVRWCNCWVLGIRIRWMGHIRVRVVITIGIFLRR